MDKKPRRFDWHRVVFWSSLLVAIIYTGIAATSKNGRFLTVFSEDGREAVKTYYRYYHPEFAKRMGWDRHWNQYVARQKALPSSKSSSSWRSSRSSP